MPKKILKRGVSLGTVLFWIAVVFTAVAYFTAVPRDRWFGSGRGDITTSDTQEGYIRQLTGPNQPIMNPNNQTVRNPNNWQGR